MKKENIQLGGFGAKNSCQNMKITGLWRVQMTYDICLIFDFRGERACSHGGIGDKGWANGTKYRTKSSHLIMRDRSQSNWRVYITCDYMLFLQFGLKSRHVAKGRGGRERLSNKSGLAQSIWEWWRWLPPNPYWICHEAQKKMAS